MKAAFADTVGLLAIWNKSDQWHEQATQALAVLSAKREILITSTYVLLECGNAAARRPFRATVERLRNELQGNDLLVHPTVGDWHLAWAAYARGDFGHAGIVDQTSFVIMRRLGITHAFTNDRHFITAGFEVLF